MKPVWSNRMAAWLFAVALLIPALQLRAAENDSAHVETIDGMPDDSAGEYRRWWLSVGLGVGTIAGSPGSTVSGVELHAGASFETGLGLFVGRITGMSGLSYNGSHMPAAADFALMYGMNSPGDVGSIAFSGGLSLVIAPKRDDPATSFTVSEKPTIGVPVLVQMFVGTGFLGIGLDLYANLNLISPYAAFSVAVPIGRL